MSTLVIAEAGVNHNGDIKLAHQLVDTAADAGADIVKFQTFSADRLVAPHAKKAAYQERNSEVAETQHEMLSRLELSTAMHLELIEHCQERGIEFSSTGFDHASIDMLIDLGVKRLKIPSGEVTNLPFLRHIAGKRKPIILSTGMTGMDDVAAALAALEKAGATRDTITVLHCTTAYPTSMSEVNLRAMLSIRDAFGVRVGYSDHTLGIEVAVAAVALGACVIEKHFTTDRNLPGPDHSASLQPGELAQMISSIRNIELALGDGVKRIATGEKENVASARKSIVASESIAAGDLFSEKNLTVMRPGNGLSPMLWDEVIGQVSTRSFERYELIEL